jgi:hypothetical protein
MTRKLLPYEHELIQQLGVTEDEYLDFLAVQFDYTRTPEQKLATPQNGELAAFIVLTVVGILFQVASVLLMPKPEIPGARNQRRAREQRFSPRFGFNSSQELGQYGDPINLVYCNTTQNPRGAVRVGTSLVWSSVESYGSTQFMQLLLVLGAAKIKALDFDRIAFGQLPLGQFSASNTWLYYEDDGNVLFEDEKLGDGKDPTRDGANKKEDVCRVMFAKERRDGYSQAFSPSSLTSFGVYDPIPVNVEVMERRSAGKPSWRDLRVIIAEGNYDTNDGARWEVGRQFTVIFRKAEKEGGVAVEAARDMRYQLVAALDKAATYMLGTAKFKLVDINPDNMNLDNNDIRAKFECIEKGRRPFTDYTKTKSRIWTEKDREDIEAAIDELEAGVSIFAPAAEETFPTYTTGNSYSATLSKEDNEVLNITLQTVERWNRDVNLAKPVGTWNGNIELKLKRYGYENYEFKGRETLEWKDELDEKKTAILPRGGSIATTEAILQEFLDAKFKLSTKKVRDEIEDDLEKLRQVIDDIETNNFDKSEFRKAAKKAASSIREKINDRQKEKKDIMDSLGIDSKSDLKTISGDKVLGEKTNLTKKYEKLVEVEDTIENLREDKDDIMSDNMAVAKRAIISFYRETNSSFRDFNGNLYGSGGIKAMKRRLSELKGEFTTDQIGVRTVRQYLKGLIEEKKQARKDAIKVEKDWETLAGAIDDNFFTKCLLKVESAAYQTVTACDFVKFAIRCKLFRRVSGRAMDYGQKEAPDGFKLSDNGIQGRMAFFKVAYKKTESSRKNYRTLPIVFAVRRNADQDNFIGLAFKGNEQAKWEFKIEPIGDIGAEIQDSGQEKVAFIENAGKVQTYDHAGSQFAWTGSLVDISGNIKNALKERGPIYTNEWDLFSVRSDTQVQFSFDGGPEFRITAVTEQQKGDNDDKYKSMSMMALGIFSGKGVQDLRSITAYVKEGKTCHTITKAGSFIVGAKYQIVQVSNTNFVAIGAASNTVGKRFTATGKGSGSGIATAYEAGSSSFAPDIFADTILDNENGIGKFAKSQGVDWNGVALAKEFCKSNRILGTDGKPVSLFMDGVISEQTPWRQFWAETAPFSLLEFARVGGRETLIPAVPVNSAGVANRQVTVNALFTAGNVLEGSYKEEFIDYGSAVQDLIATVIYRETESQDVFPRNSSVTVSLKDVNANTAILQSFDLSQFVTHREQAILFGKLVCNQRRHIRRGIEFKTFPTDTPISPGAYIYVDIGLNWERISSGLIMEGGALNAPLTDGINNGSYSVLIYRNNEQVRSFDSVAVSSGIAAALAPYAGYMFVLGAKSDRKRVFRVVEVQMDEEGEITVKAMEHPCDTSGSLLLSRIANFSGSLFDVR